MHDHDFFHGRMRRALHDLLHHHGAFEDDDSGEPSRWDCAGRGGHGRHRGGPGGHGFRPFGFGGGGPGGFGQFRAGRKLSSADLQLLLLHLVGQRPRHGYELIKAVEELSNGFYVPSPGVIYPALTYLEEVGDAAAELEGTRKRYQLTDAGRARLAERDAEVKELLEHLAHLGRRMDRVREAFAEEGEADPGGADAPFDEGRGFRGEVRELRAALRALRGALHEKRRSPREELARVAEILLRAAEEIRGGRG